MRKEIDQKAFDKFLSDIDFGAWLNVREYELREKQSDTSEQELGHVAIARELYDQFRNEKYQREHARQHTSTKRSSADEADSAG